MNTLIIGGGAAGMAAAIAAARSGQRVTVWERGRKPLKKLGVTGNGRGNLLNDGAPEYYGDTAFALSVLARMPWQSVAAFWQSVGVPLAREAEGRVYPASFLASTAVDALTLETRRLGVTLVSCTRALSLEALPGGGFRARGTRAVYAPDTPRKSGKAKPGQLLTEEPVQTEADRVIVAVGGAADPAHGTDGTAYGLLTAFGHTLVPPRPALCALTTETSALQGLSGQRVRAALTLADAQGRTLAQSRGEALFAADGVSGIAAMQLARFARPGCILRLDLREALTGDPGADTRAWLTHRARRVYGFRDLLVGAATPELSDALWRMCGSSPSLTPDALGALARAIEAFCLPVTGTRGFAGAQVTAGGVRPCEFDCQTLQSRLCPGLYAAGEVLDVDGGCGGFNLLFAVATGLLAGQGVIFAKESRGGA